MFTTGSSNLWVALGPQLHDMRRQAKYKPSELSTYEPNETIFDILYGSARQCACL